MTPSSTITNTTAVAGEGDGEKGKEVVVDWYGDDDPENPQNWYVHLAKQQPSVTRIKYRWSEGHEKGKER